MRSKHVRNSRVFRRTEQAAFWSESYGELVEEGHVCRQIMAIVAGLELGWLKELYLDYGGVAYDPKVLLGVILFGLTDGVRSTRALSEHCRYDNRYRLLCGGLVPDDRTFGRFLERLGERSEQVLAHVVALAQARGMGAMRTVSVDGTKVAGNVSNWKRGLAGIEVSDPDARKRGVIGPSCPNAHDPQPRDQDNHKES